jgi:hypothetical protein
MKKLKWLEYFKGLYELSPDFVKEMDTQLRPIFEVYFGRPLNWALLYLFVEPTGKALQYTVDDGGKKVASLECAIKYGAMNIWCDVIWYPIDEDRYVEPSEDIGSGKVIFEVINYYDGNNRRDSFPGIEVVMPYSELNLGLDFPVIIEGKQIGHEGYIAIEVTDVSVLPDLNSSIADIQKQWNEDDGQKIEIEPFTGYRGLLHGLYFSEQEDENTIILYFDSGSAVDGVHEHIIKTIAKKIPGIKRVEIRQL